MSRTFAFSPSGDNDLQPVRQRDGADGETSRDKAAFWTPVALVVFDVDGTLYRQGPLRRVMMRELLCDAFANRTTRTFSLLRLYRNLREELAEAETADFEDILRSRVADAMLTDPAQVAEAIETWMQWRPLRHLASCAVPGLAEAFTAIRRSGRRIGILSDYPAKAKLVALGLEADIVVDAALAGRLKPHPAGLQHVMRLAGVDPAATVMVGDRAERDGEAARRASVACVLRNTKPQPGYRTFIDYRAPLFVDIPRFSRAF